MGRADSHQKIHHQTGPALKADTATKGDMGHKVAPGSCQATGHLELRVYYLLCIVWLRDILGSMITTHGQPGLGDVPSSGDCPMCRCLGLRGSPCTSI